MKDLEDQARPWLIQMIDGQPVSLDLDGQRIIAAWVTKVSLMAQHSRAVDIPRIGRPWYEEFIRLSGVEPPGWLKIGFGAWNRDDGSKGGDHFSQVYARFRDGVPLIIPPGSDSPINYVCSVVGVDSWIFTVAGDTDGSRPYREGSEELLLGFSPRSLWPSTNELVDGPGSPLVGFSDFVRGMRVRWQTHEARRRAWVGAPPFRPR